MAEIEHKISLKVGKVYAENHIGRALIGEGFDALERFIEELAESNAEVNNEPVSAEQIVKRLSEVYPEIECEVGIIIRVRDDFDFGDREVYYYQPMPIRIEDIKMPEMVDCSYLLITPKTPPPPYVPKLHSYDKRRKYSGKAYWNRIRSRLF